MNKIKRYTDYCALFSAKSGKEGELRSLELQQGKLRYDLSEINNKIKKYNDISTLTSGQLQSIKRMRMINCFSHPVTYEAGGKLGLIPMETFLKSSDYKEFNAQQKKLFNTVKPYLELNQYSLQNLIVVAEEDDDEFDVYSENIVEDFIDNTMKESGAYETLDIKELKEMKKIMYIFVEHVSKFN